MSLAVGRALDATAFALATAAGIAVGYVAILVKRRRVSSDDEVAAKIIKTPEPPGFSLLTELVDDDAFLELIRLLPALSSARLARINKSAHARISSPTWPCGAPRAASSGWRSEMLRAICLSPTRTRPNGRLNGCTCASTRRASHRFSSNSRPTR